MKLSDGRKVRMHKTPQCEERSRIQEEISEHLAAHLACLDNIRQTPKTDPSQSEKVSNAKDAKAKLSAAESQLRFHILEHGCW
jgi:hypothetical protein